jgi:ABC-type antimicrobial peptide transport system permease subunit
MTNQPVVGRHLRFPGSVYQSAAAEIVGIAADARENGVNQAPVPTIYWCLSAPDPSPYILVRTAADPAAMSFVIRRKIHDIEPSRSVFDVVPLEEILFNANGENRFRTMLLTLFALTAIALASLGLYGTLSYFVSLRHREVGLRMALGALPKQILGSFFVQGLAVAAFGCFGGLCLALALSRFLSSMLWGITRSDAFSYLTVTGLVLLVAAIASVLPAARAAHVDPMNALRDQ